jgi:hypothetical protein
MEIYGSKKRTYGSPISVEYIFEASQFYGSGNYTLTMNTTDMENIKEVEIIMVGIICKVKVKLSHYRP